MMGKEKQTPVINEGTKCLHGKRDDDGHIRLTFVEYDEHICICEVCGKHMLKDTILGYAYSLNNIIL